jgi:hypothetical protein
MSRKQAFARRYGANAQAVLSSIAKVARAGRTGNHTRIEAERARHRVLMANLP